MPFAANWNDEAFAYFVERSPATDGDGPISLHHPQYPYVVELASSNPADLIGDVNSSIAPIADAYLRRVEPLLFNRAAGSSLLYEIKSEHGAYGFRSFENGFRLAWLPLTTGPDRDGSVMLVRHDPAHLSDPLDISLVLFAVQVWEDGKPATAMRSGFGLRVTASLCLDSVNGFALRFEGVDVSARLRTVLETERSAASIALHSYLAAVPHAFAGLGAALAPTIAAAAGDPKSQVYLQGIRIEPEDEAAGLVTVFAHAVRSSSESAEPAYSIVAKLAFGGGAPVLAPIVLSTSKSPLVAHVVGILPPTAHLFATPTPWNGQLSDAASLTRASHVEDVRPNRSSEALKTLRKPIPLRGLLPGTVDLQDAPASPWFEVRKSTIVDRAANGALVHLADGAVLAHARISDFTAVSAYRALCDLFAKIEGFGLPREAFLWPCNITAPLIVRYWSGMTRGPGRDGKIVNAEVNYDPPQAHLGAAAPAGPRSIQLRLALADMQRSSSRREPLGIATDPRWMWHEFGHVLLVGATGRLEFNFAHSPGDALAAIVNDPRSELAQDMRPYGLRGATFPWVYLNRRHDRRVESGWSWSGSYHRPLRFDPANCDCRRMGYDSEQILSTTLFRLYRSVGGDTVDAASVIDRARRIDASDYTVYLIMRAIAVFGLAAWVSPQTPVLLANCLMHADRVTRRSTSGLLRTRVGGCVHKVVRWAFEQQGLCADVPDNQIHDAVGKPPRVDVFIDDRRAAVDAAHRAGEYTPVSLDWTTAAPAWHASAQGISIGPGGVSVTVGNRGTGLATQVRVLVWFKERLAATPLVWNRHDNSWTHLNPGPAAPGGPIASGSSQTYGPFPGLPSTSGKRYLVLAEVHALGDLANTHNALPVPVPFLDLPCAIGDTRLVDLVANDNNLGLLEYVVP